MLSPLWQAKWQISNARPGCRETEEFASHNMFASRYVISRGLSEFMANYRRLCQRRFIYIAIASAAHRHHYCTFAARIRMWNFVCRGIIFNLIYPEIKILRKFLGYAKIARIASRFIAKIIR